MLGGVRRGALGYTGVIVSDDLDRKAIRDHYGPGDAAVEAVAAGCDALLLCADRDAQVAAFDALVAAARADDGVRARVADAAARVRALAGPAAPVARTPDLSAALAVLGCERHRQLARALAGGDDAG